MADDDSPDRAESPVRRTLPDDPSIDHLRGQARSLQRAVRRGDADALAQVARRHPDAGALLAAADRLPLSAAQLVVARGYGLPSWPALVRRLDIIAAYRRDPDVEPDAANAAGDHAEAIARLGCLTYSSLDEPARWAAADRLIAADPESARVTIWTAAAASDPDGVRRWIDADPSLAQAEGGPHRWTPLMYLCYSRVGRAADRRAVLDAAHALTRAGADPNVGYLWHGLPTPFTALTGAFGEGEQGPGRQPRHPHSVELAALLLDAGADPNDGQALYNRMFRPDDSHLRVLYAHGLGSASPSRWVALLGDAVETPRRMLRRVLRWAVSHDFEARVALLAQHGLDVTAPFGDGQRPIDIAARRGNRRIVALLRDAGAAAPHLDPVERLIGIVLGGDRDAALSQLREGPDLVAEVRGAHPGLMLQALSADAVEVAALLGFDVDAVDGEGATALHHAAWNGDVALIDALLRHGADPTRREPRYDLPPMGWAQHALATEAIVRLSSA